MLPLPHPAEKLRRNKEKSMRDNVLVFLYTVGLCLAYIIGSMNN
jgi:hypothetical protein